ncbi:ABC transporter permease [Actinomadura rifamycini]|uniref:ABC transporter permease n=1 Tax=Actinomadura rifamycini TaxID=31962 RepID=UPI00040A68D8|nr:ABC transporter permease [Actinomadura rifamycini]
MTVVPVRDVTARRVLRAEWSKLGTLRSGRIALAAAAAALPAIGVIDAAGFDPAAVPEDGTVPDSRDAVAVALTGMPFAVLAVAVLGALGSAGEYGTGLIRATLTAVPRRLPVLWSKCAVYGGAVLAVAVLAAVASFLLGGLALPPEADALSLADPGVPRRLAGAGAHLALVAVIAVALGMLVRNSAGAIAVLVAALLVLPELVGLLPGGLPDAVRPYLPSSAGAAMTAAPSAPDLLGPWAGAAVLASWTAAAVAGAAVRLVRTDA